MVANKEDRSQSQDCRIASRQITDLLPHTSNKYRHICVFLVLCRHIHTHKHFCEPQIVISCYTDFKFEVWHCSRRIWFYSNVIFSLLVFCLFLFALRVLTLTFFFLSLCCDINFPSAKATREWEVTAAAFGRNFSYLTTSTGWVHWTFVQHHIPF